MSRGISKNGCGLILAAIVMAAFEGFVFLRWIFFGGSAPSLRDLQAGLGLLAALWVGSMIANWLERREARDREIAARIRATDARIEALYKWGRLRFSGDDEKDNDDWEWELDDETKAEIAECREGIKRGDTTSHHNLGVIFWNHAMTYYNAHSNDGYREASRWLRKAASLDYDCENTLGDAYIKLQNYDEAMYWYRRSLKRRGSLAWIAESNIADMYSEGQGVSQNHAEAAWWWERAAQHGSDWSHYKLGKLYAEGADGVEKDNRKAYFHLYIASSTSGQYSPQKSAIELCEQVEKKLSEYSLSQEKKRAEEWLAAQKEVARQKTKSEVRPLPLPE